jgi:hypothetical protein
MCQQMVPTLGGQENPRNTRKCFFGSVLSLTGAPFWQHLLRYLVAFSATEARLNDESLIEQDDALRWPWSGKERYYDARRGGETESLL